MTQAALEFFPSDEDQFAQAYARELGKFTRQVGNAFNDRSVSAVLHYAPSSRKYYLLVGFANDANALIFMGAWEPCLREMNFARFMRGTQPVFAHHLPIDHHHVMVTA